MRFENKTGQTLDVGAIPYRSGVGPRSDPRALVLRLVMALLVAAMPILAWAESTPPEYRDVASGDISAVTSETEWYGDRHSQCETLPEFAPKRTILVLAARVGDEDNVGLLALREALTSYLTSSVRTIPPSRYDPASLEEVDALVVLGNGRFDDPVKVRQALLQARDRGVPIAWIGPGGERYADELGLRFAENATAPQTGAVREIAYNGVTMATETLVFAAPLAAEGQSETEVLARMTASDTPVILHRENLTYVGLLPFADNGGWYPLVATIDSVARLFGERERNRRALFRLEDISASAYGPDAPAFREVTELLRRRRVFMHLGIIPQDVEHNPADADARVLTDIGASHNVIGLAWRHPDEVEIVQHGFRHYRPDPRNEGCEVPGCGWEFFEDDDETLGVEASAAFARARMTAGQDLLAQHFSPPMVFEAPHYTLTPAQAAVAEELYPLILHQPLSYGGEPGGFFLPWFTYRTPTVYAPSDVGYVAYDDPQSVDYILENMDEVARLLPDPVVIVFFHPFIWQAEGRRDDLDRLIDGIEQLGYRFVSACEELSSVE